MRRQYGVFTPVFCKKLYTSPPQFRSHRSRSVMCSMAINESTFGVFAPRDRNVAAAAASLSDQREREPSTAAKKTSRQQDGLALKRCRAQHGGRGSGAQLTMSHGVL